MIKKIFSITTFMTLLCASKATARDPEWFKSRIEMIDSISTFPELEQIQKLGRVVGPIGSNSVMDEEQRELYYRARTALIKIPSHADYYKNKILKAQERAKTVPGSLQHYLNEVNESIGVLSQLPSPETLRVLGDFLSDEWKSPNVIQSDINRGVGSMAHYAVYALAKLPLLNKPADTQRVSGEAKRDLRTWQLWYAQIKAGTRTFRFEGDPNEYTLAGPVTKEDAKRRDHEQQREAERTAAAKKATGAAASSPASAVGGNFPRAGMIAGGIVALSLAWYFLRKRKAA